MHAGWSMPARIDAPAFIAAIIGAVVGFFAIVVIGILAAIALPAYQQYVVRSQIVQAFKENLHGYTYFENH